MGKRGPKKGEGGRPEKELDWKLIGNMCSIHCTEAEIAGVIECGIDTLNRRCKKEYGKTFKEFLEEKRGTGRAGLRRRLWLLSERGNVAATIFLSKNWLGMKDKPDAPILESADGEFSIQFSVNDDAGYGKEGEG